MALTISIGALLGCASSPKPTEVTGSITASAKLNPSVNQRPSPLQLRIYELKSATAFGNADFMSLYQRDQAELGAELVAREEIVIAPGETRRYSKTLAPEVRFIGVVASYRDLEKARWRSVVPVQPGKKQQLTIQADELAISATIGN